MTTYTTIGPVREGCGHEHRSLDTALRCLADDARDCRKRGGESDRNVYARDDAHRRAGPAYLKAPPGLTPVNARPLDDDERRYRDAVDFPGIDQIDRSCWR